MEFGLYFGALSPDITTQLDQQDLKYSKEKVAHFQKWADALSLLFFNDILSEAERSKAQHRLFMQVRKHVMHFNNLKPTPKKKASAN